MGCDRKREFSLWIIIFYYLRLKKLLTHSHLVRPCKLVALVDDLGHRGHRDVDVLAPLSSKYTTLRMKMRPGQTSLTPDQPVVVTLSQQGSTVLSRSRHDENHASRLLWKSRFTRKKLAFSHISREKPIKSHENTAFTTLLAPEFSTRHRQWETGNNHLKGTHRGRAKNKMANVCGLQIVFRRNFLTAF